MENQEINLEKVKEFLWKARNIIIADQSYFDPFDDEDLDMLNVLWCINEALKEFGELKNLEE